MTEAILSLLGANGWLFGVLTGVLGIVYGLWQGTRASRAKEEARDATELNQQHSERARRINQAKAHNKQEEIQQSKSDKRDVFETTDI